MTTGSFKFTDKPESKEKPEIDCRNDNIVWEESLTNFYAQLLSKQQSLGREFEQILDDHFWDLIIRK